MMLLHELVTADGFSVSTLQAREDEGGEDGEAAEEAQAQVNSVNHGLRITGIALRHEEGGCESRGGNAKADRHLLHGARDGAGATGVVLVNVGVYQRVH